jgi:CubicO group peptidase (beta-lactamase class C family)
MRAGNKMRVRLNLTMIPLVLFLASCSQLFEPSTERRIESVEHGLLSAQGDPPWKRMELTERMQHHHVPGVSIAVINDNQIEWTKGYGVLEAGKTEPVTPETLFQTGSVAKPVVAVAALQYVEQGILELDSDVNQSLLSWHVPENQFTTEEKVTLRRLLSHTAGLTAQGFRGYAQGEAIPNLQQILDGEPPANSPPVRVNAVPGTQYLYSNGGYMIVQQLFEDLTGRPFPEIMQTTVLEPWGMTTSTFESPLPKGLWATAASGHRADGRAIPGRWHTYPEMGSGGSMWSTPSDLARFAIHVMLAYQGRPGEVLSQEMAIQMLTPQLEDSALGPYVVDDGGDRFYFLHAGAVDGYKSYLVAYPKRGQGVVIMTNSDNGDALWREILNSVSVEYGWLKDYTWLYVSLTLVVLLALLGILFLRWRKPASRHFGRLTKNSD